MESRQPLTFGAVLDGRYRIDRLVGAGSFGMTYAAHDLALDTPVAVKEYFPREYARRDSDGTVSPAGQGTRGTFEHLRSGFIREARTLARFEHAAIVRIFNVIETNGTAYTVMRYEPGPSLKTWRDELGRPPTQAELDKICGPMLSALETMHGAGYLHRDIAPDNILIRPDGGPVLLDFGAARQLIGKQRGQVTGIVKHGFSPQEQYDRDGLALGPWSDIYAFAATLYRTIAGTSPQRAQERSVEDRMQAAAGLDGELRPSFLAAIDWALSPRPEDRPQSVAEWTARLLPPGADAAGRAAVVPERADEALPAAPEVWLRRLAIVAGIGLVAMGAVVLAERGMHSRRAGTAGSGDARQELPLASVPVPATGGTTEQAGVAAGTDEAAARREAERLLDEERRARAAAEQRAEAERLAAAESDRKAREEAERAERAEAAARRAAREAALQQDAANSPSAPAAPATPQPSAPQFDGAWTVTRSVTEACGPKGAVFTIRINRGAVAGPGGTGSVSASGDIRFPGKANHFSGKLAGSSGRGTYTGRCSGTFVMRRS